MDTSSPAEGWHVLWTHSNQERSVAGQLEAKGYEVFLPMINQWSARNRGLAVAVLPMFRSYLFLRHAVDKHAYLDICRAKGLVCLLGERWDKLSTIPDAEISSIRTLMDSQLPTQPYPWLAAGTRVRITRGSLMNAEGILVASEFQDGLFVISVKLLQRSVAVRVSFADVEAL